MQKDLLLIVQLLHSRSFCKTFFHSITFHFLAHMLNMRKNMTFTFSGAGAYFQKMQFSLEAHASKRLENVVNRRCLLIDFCMYE